MGEGGSETSGVRDAGNCFQYDSNDCPRNACRVLKTYYYNSNYYPTGISVCFPNCEYHINNSQACLSNSERTYRVSFPGCLWDPNIKRCFQKVQVDKYEICTSDANQNNADRCLSSASGQCYYNHTSGECRYDCPYLT
eukprot:PhF_6_TR41341/c0_g1_i2/m.62721